jgi:hypothetical protein
VRFSGLRCTRADDYAGRILPSATTTTLEDLAREFKKRPEFVRVLNRFVNREIRRIAKRRRG